MSASRQRGSFARVLGVALLVGGLVGASVLFADSEGTIAVAEDAAVQVRAQGLIGGVSVSRAALSEALVFGLAYENKQMSESSFHAVLSEADNLLVDLSDHADTLGELAAEAEVSTALETYLGAAAALLNDLEAGDVAAAQGSDSVALRASYAEVVDLLVSLRDERERQIAAVRHGVGEVANAARFVVAFFVPALVALWALVLMRRRQHRLQVAVEIKRDEQVRAAKDEFLTAVAHELRTPLTAVTGFAETLRDRSRHLTSKDRDELVDILADEASDTASIVEDLLVFARANIGDLTIRPEAVRVLDLIDKVTLRWQGRHENRLSISGDDTVWADPLRLKQAMRNLLLNAFEHGGSRVDIRIVRDGSQVRIEVADDGAAIAPELRAKLFEPYMHGVNRSGSPTSLGLGLTVAQSLVRLMGGTVIYDYRGGESIFAVSLPAATQQQEEDLEGRARPLGAGTAPSPTQVIEAIQNQQFEIVYQPIFDLDPREAGHRIVGYEALSRFAYGSPPEWFAAASAAGIGVELELEAIRRAVAGFRGIHHTMFLAVNASMETLASPHLAGALSEISPGRIVLELSEDTVIDDYTRAKIYVDRLTRQGYRLAFDDLAQGRIDLWYLVRLRPAIIKMDMSLIHRIDHEPSQRGLVNGLKWLSEVLKSRIVAEGIERSEELDILTRLGVHYGQGYLLGRPGPLPPSADPTPETSSTTSLGVRAI